MNATMVNKAVFCKKVIFDLLPGIIGQLLRGTLKILKFMKIVTKVKLENIVSSGIYNK